MPIRITDRTIFLICFLISYIFIPSGTIEDEPSKLLITFLGIVAASIMPTITLLVNSTSGEAHSIKEVEELGEVIKESIDSLFYLFLTVILAVLAIVLLNTQSPWPWLSKIDPNNFRSKLCQSTAISLVFLSLNKTVLVKQCISKCIVIKTKIAKSNAQNRTYLNFEKAQSANSTMENSSKFGTIVSMEKDE